MLNLIPNFIKKIEFESNFKVFELEPCDIGAIQKCVCVSNEEQTSSIYTLSST